jgi:hypothetical protein
MKPNIPWAFSLIAYEFKKKRLFSRKARQAMYILLNTEARSWTIVAVEKQ